MTTLTTRRLDVLTRVAGSHTDRAAEALARSRSGLAEQEVRLGELRRYAEEYRARPMPMTPTLIANRERFLARLDEAERQQVRTVEAAVQAVRESTRQWLDRRAGQQKFDTLHEAAAARESWRAEQQAQKQLDEFGVRLASSRPFAPDSE
jgi:flagellar FliJ protein